MPLAVDLVPRQLDHPPLGVEVQHADVGRRAVLDVVHQGVERDLEQVVAGLAGRRELVVDDPVMRRPPVVEDVVERARDAHRLAVRADLEGHVDASSTVAEEVVDDLGGRLAAAPGVGDDLGQLAHVDLDGADERLLLRRPACAPGHRG